MPTRPELEAMLTRLWSEKLNITPVGVEDNFFALGGDSLLAADLLMDVYEQFGIEVDAAVLFLKPTIAELVDEVLAA
ncbi:phosphopantetheine-binding protein [Micromonospora avicenniae]|uniref:Phosphopantetheine attachment site n=2 Tax=Micromonospora TaxID=1873 RepID=A0A1N6ZS07_9ACTN|nr:phosphopantetheine-binding protein [Micromonospora avicenniae]SIR29554.1 Phosphopantetheine attachment site [Micromonospora avicenniae]